MKTAKWLKRFCLFLLCLAVTVLPVSAEEIGDPASITGSPPSGPSSPSGPPSPSGPSAPSAPSSPSVPFGPSPVSPSAPYSSWAGPYAPGWSSSCTWGWGYWPSVKPARKRTTTRKTETLVSSTPISARGFTNVTWVNLRATPSVYGSRVRKIHDAGTAVTVTAEVTNSSGQLWYAVTMADGTAGYIRSDLLNLTEVATQPPAEDTAGAQVIYVIRETEEAPAPETAPTPTPIIVYLTPEPTPAPAAEVTPQIIYVYAEQGT